MAFTLSMTALKTASVPSYVPRMQDTHRLARYALDLFLEYPLPVLKSDPDPLIAGYLCISS